MHRKSTDKWDKLELSDARMEGLLINFSVNKTTWPEKRYFDYASIKLVLKKIIVKMTSIFFKIAITYPAEKTISISTL